MAKQLFFIDQWALDRLAEAGRASKYETADSIYLPLSSKPKIELIDSPRPVDRDHLRRDFQSKIDDLETVIRHLKYMKSEI